MTAISNFNIDSGKPSHKQCRRVLPVYPRHLPAQNRGVALITAVLIISLITVAATAMAARQLLDTRRTGNLMHSDQAYTYALAGEQLVARVMQDFDRDRAVDHPAEAWFQELPVGLPLPMPNGSVTLVAIRDATASFPLNSLVNASGEPQNNNFRMLQSMTDTLITNPPLPELPAAIRDWIDPNQNVSAGGAEDLDYLSLDPPYRAANSNINSISELRLIAGVTPEAYAALLGSADGQPLFNTLPWETPININSAPREVLLNLHDRIEETHVNDIISHRDERIKNKTAPFANKAGFENFVKDKIFSPPPTDPAEKKALREFRLDADVGVTSNYFEITTLAQVGKSTVTLHSLLMRDETQVTTIRRGIGAF